MKEAIGGVPIYSFIILFIVLAAGFLAATVTYFKAFKLNSRIALSLEKFEGFNSESAKEINEILESYSYRKDTTKITCSNNKPGMELLSTNGVNYSICIYESGLKNGYFNYGITTYIYLDIPVISQAINLVTFNSNGTDKIRIPVYTESEKIYKFTVG